MKTTANNNSETKKFYVIASNEYEANMPDLFVMDADGNYYGVSDHSYARWHNFPKSIDHWMNIEGSDSGRYFIIDEVELPTSQVVQFEILTAEYCKLDAETPKFGEEYPNRIFGGFKTKKAYDQAVETYMEHYREWCEASNIGEYISRKNELWKARILLFITFSKNVYEAIKDNDNIKHA